MKAELQFFITEKDSEAFLQFATEKVDLIEDNERLIIGDCTIHFKPSELHNDTLFIGHIMIDTGTADNACKDQEKAKALFRSLRNWLKKHYTCKLSFTDNGKASMSRSHWLGPDARRWKEEDSTRQLKLSEQSTATFEVAKVSKLMGEIIPKKSRKKGK